MRISSIIPCVRNANGSGHEQRRQTDGPGKDEVNRMNDFRKTAQEMLEFIRISPTCFHAVANIGRMLEAAGFQQLQEKEEWKLEKGGRYYTERNDSSVIAFVIPEKEVGIRGFHMAADRISPRLWDSYAPQALFCAKGVFLCVHALPPRPMTPSA